MIDAIEQMRIGGRQLVADEIAELLHSIREDPEEDEDIQPDSLRAMARFLVEHQEYADPLTGPDPNGIMQAEWRIFGDGLVVMAFLDGEHVRCIAQAEPPDETALNVSDELPARQAAEKYGRLIPRW